MDSVFPASLQLQCDKAQITAHIGGEFILICEYDTNTFRYSKKYWCRGDSRSTCEILVDSESVAKNTQRSHIIDAVRRGLFVKVTDLQFDDTGVYWVGIDKIYADIMTSVNVVITEGKNKTEAWKMYITITISATFIDCTWTFIWLNEFKYITCFFDPVPVSKPRLWPSSPLVDRPTCWGQPVTVRCGCTKGTGVRYAWYQNTQHDSVLLHHSSDLFLHCGAVDTDSYYYCVASNDISSEGSDILSVQVLVPADSSCIYVVNMQGKNRCWILSYRYQCKNRPHLLWSLSL